MTTPRDPDSIVATWLEEGPTELPEATRRAIAVATRTTRQSRRAFGVPWRMTPMNPIPRVAIALAAIVAVAGGAVFIMSPRGQSVGGPGPTLAGPSIPLPSAAPSPSPTLSVSWQTVLSDRFGYTVQIPGTWTVSALIDDLPDELYPGLETEYGDRWDQPVTRVPWLIIAVRDPEPEETLDAWMARYTADLESACDASEAVPADIGGEPGTVRAPACMSGVAAVEGLVAHGGRAYTITLSGRSQEVDVIQATFDRIIASFRFTN